MNGASGFQEVRSSTSRSPSYRLLHEQQHRFGTDTWHLLRTQDLIARSRGISTKREKVPNSCSVLRNTMLGSVHSENIQFGRKD